MMAAVAPAVVMVSCMVSTFGGFPLEQEEADDGDGEERREPKLPDALRSEAVGQLHVRREEQRQVSLSVEPVEVVEVAAVGEVDATPDFREARAAVRGEATQLPVSRSKALRPGAPQPHR